jgi:nicotinate phosphoribosyltransferase
MIINSLLQTDQYKINMLRVYLYHFSNVTGKFIFKCRNQDIIFTEAMLKIINDEIDHLCTLRFTEDEIQFIMNMNYHKDAIGFGEFLRMFKLNRNYIKCWLDSSKQLHIEADGPIFAITMFEIYILSIVNETYFKEKYKSNYEELINEGKLRLQKSLNTFIANPFPLTEFGTRRRFSCEWQDYVISVLVERIPRYLSGTSNIFYAKKYGLVSSGTFAHEFCTMPMGLKDTRLSESQRYAWKTWMEEYNGNLGICLQDTLGWDKFEKDFDRFYANLFTGVRFDSGDNFECGERMLKLYEKYGIDPKTKTLMWSDSLNFEKAIEINNYFKDKTKTAFGIGTFITNNMGVEPLNIIMKLQEVDGHPVAKLSNVESKTMCQDDDFVSYLRKAIL